ncbi:Bgt-3292 [Blumeria graminis f. sp. tritici]|uniref:Lysophospholipase n=2 Tax=Blumeria graminis f. sp. tritici TaxID=62690 RepID=A0A381LHF5_BLUGR|nr:Phospholipase [Blumeria graminis f. sp. tritici 96224]VCU40873.1 Bgt-3292 [Blumeria graminis f. sp. tritici]
MVGFFFCSKSITCWLVLLQVFSAIAKNIPPQYNVEEKRYSHKIKRALPDSPSKDYAPAVVDCPENRPTIRNAEGISPDEAAWLELRRKQIFDPMVSWLSRMGIPDFDAPAYMNRIKDDPKALPNIGIAASGGGYRALMNGGGFLAAADIRTINSTETGHIGGLLQASTYLAGLSGGSWLVGSMYINNFSSVQELRDGNPDTSIWKFGNSILEGPETQTIQILTTAEYFRTILSDVRAKDRAGFNTSITDYWGRALSHQLVNADDGGPSYTFSSIAQQESFKNASTPFPLIIANNRRPGVKTISTNSTIVEFNPYELGSWDASTNGFAPMRYLGSNFSNGVVPPGGKCVRGFDQAGFVMGTSSTLFNQILLSINETRAPNIIHDAVLSLGAKNNDIAQYQPNPFFGYNAALNPTAKSMEFSLVDGGEDGQNIPLYPLIQPQRNVDVIFAVDSSADTEFNWPNGTSLVATYERSMDKSIQSNIAFPSIPDQNTFINLGLNSAPTFFGCDASNSTSPTPLVVYIPNSPYSIQSNSSTFNLSYTDTQRNLIIRNGYNVATLGNGTSHGNVTADTHWPTCVACAVLNRSFGKTKTPAPEACKKCYERYCWNGTLASHMPTMVYQPVSKVGHSSSTFTFQVNFYLWLLAFVAAIWTI